MSKVSDRTAAAGSSTHGLERRVGGDSASPAAAELRIPGVLRLETVGSGSSIEVGVRPFHAPASERYSSLAFRGVDPRSRHGFPAFRAGSILVPRSGSGHGLASRGARTSAGMPADRDGPGASDRGRRLRPGPDRRPPDAEPTVAGRLAPDVRPSRRLHPRGLGGVAGVLWKPAEPRSPRRGHRTVPAAGRDRTALWRSRDSSRRWWSTGAPQTRLAIAVGNARSAVRRRGESELAGEDDVVRRIDERLEAMYEFADRSLDVHGPHRAIAHRLLATLAYELGRSRGRGSTRPGPRDPASRTALHSVTD